MTNATETRIVPLGARIVAETQCKIEHLSIVLARKPGGQLVCWMYNSDTDGFFWGHYADNAVDVYLQRIDDLS